MGKLDHSAKLSAITHAETVMATFNAMPVGATGALSPGDLVLCNNVLSNVQGYRTFIQDVDVTGLSSRRIGSLVRSSDHYKTVTIATIDPRFQDILTFAEYFNRPQNLIESRLSRYQELKTKVRLTPAELVELGTLESNYRDIRNHVGVDIFKSVVWDIKHDHNRKRELASITANSKFTLSALPDIDALASAINKAGDPKIEERERNQHRQSVSNFIRDLGGKVSDKNINSIIESEGVLFDEFHRLVRDLRNPATRAGAEATLTTAMTNLGVEGSDQVRIIGNMSRPIDLATISANAATLAMPEPRYRELLRNAYGTRPDLATLFPGAIAGWGRRSAINRLDASIEAEIKEIVADAEWRAEAVSRVMLVK